MDIAKTIFILEVLASGCSPRTGEVLTNDSVLNERDVIRALQIAIDELKHGIKVPIESNTKAKSATHKNIDFFRKERFNIMSSEAIDNLRKSIREIGVTKTDNLSEYVINARVNHPRAYEPWTPKEKNLLIEAMKLTNDLDFLSNCFQRGRGSIESCGQEIIYEAEIADVKPN